MYGLTNVQYISRRYTNKVSFFLARALLLYTLHRDWDRDEARQACKWWWMAVIFQGASSSASPLSERGFAQFAGRKGLSLSLSLSLALSLAVCVNVLHSDRRKMQFRRSFDARTKSKLSVANVFFGRERERESSVFSWYTGVLGRYTVCLLKHEHVVQMYFHSLWSILYTLHTPCVQEILTNGVYVMLTSRFAVVESLDKALQLFRCEWKIKRFVCLKKKIERGKNN